MEWLDKIWSQLDIYLSIPYLLTFMFLSYLIKKYFSTLLEKITRFEWKTVYTVLVIATLLAIPFLLFTEEGWVKIFITYAIGTSLHELVFGYIEKKLK
jgi:hypothetical protein